MQLNRLANAGRDHVQPVVGVQYAASLRVGNLFGIKTLLVLFRITVRAVIRESASTESGLLQKQMQIPFTLNGGQSAIVGHRLRQGIFFSISYRQYQITFLIVEHICRINLVGLVTYHEHPLTMFNHRHFYYLSHCSLN